METKGVWAKMMRGRVDVVGDGVNHEEGGAVEQRVGGASDDQAHEENDSEHLALEGHEGEALAR